MSYNTANRRRSISIGRKTRSHRCQRSWTPGPRWSPRRTWRSSSKRATRRRNRKRSSGEEFAASHLYDEVPAEAGLVRRARVNSFGSARELVVLLITRVNLFWTAGRGHEQL